MPWHCNECDSEDVSAVSWVNPNTLRDTADWQETERTFCADCQVEDMGIVYKDFFPPTTPHSSGITKNNDNNNKQN